MSQDTLKVSLPELVMIQTKKKPEQNKQASR
jgi:hypothetical protein